MRPLHHSLVVRIVALLLIIGSMAIASISATIFIAHRSQGDAEAINVAGSLRLYSAQISQALQQAPTNSDERIDAINRVTTRFSERLASPALTDRPRLSSNGQADATLTSLNEQWQRDITPLIERAKEGDSRDIQRAITGLDGFIDAIDDFVTLLEDHNQDKISFLTQLQIWCLVLIGLLLAVALYDLRTHLIMPLRHLIQLSQEIGKRNFAYRASVNSHDELGQLGQTFNQMAAELATSYQELESRILHKQAELERHNRALQIIHDGSRVLYGGGNDLCSSAAPMLRELEALLDIGPITLSLHNLHDNSDMEILATHSLERPQYCRDLDCVACLEPTQRDSRDKLQSPASRIDNHPQLLELPITVGRLTLGYLTIGYSSPISDSTRQLLNTLSGQLATAIYLQQRIEEQQQLSLIKERTIIARELHDSLAQSLSYLKMQVARLERMQAKAVPVEQQNGVMGDLRDGLNSAYRQLRELLSTFRLSLDKPGLQAALQQTVDEFSERLGFPITFSYAVPPHLLSANEDVHILQITREALTNTLKHANAQWAGVSLSFQQAELHLAIEDDGIGLKTSASPPMHFGLIIMRDRASHINGTLTFNNRPNGGAGVYLCFTPQTNRLIKEARL
ncbi:histidine kinase [Vreelandella arcis]|uniref:Sensor protein n=1 Tax=Vreelandella arcis TaxID=416873 RepID=A0A1G9YBU1_9GAMM|nr:histidine kinase [Halomonas arcis]SDN06552.1 two-component system, NarL family, nitrate/nitrite sensor histidine kinase NarX [Halomonas arcis]